MKSPLRSILLLCTLCLVLCTLKANDTVYVSGAIQHDGLLEHNPWYYGSNSYVDFSVHYLNDSNSAHFHSLRASTRAELTQWPLPGYDPDFKGYGISHISLEANFDFGDFTIGDIYAQFGSGLILNLYEDRSLGIDGALRGAKFDLMPDRGVHLTLLGGKQRRYWNCYKDHAFGWNYTRDAVLGADLELHFESWSPKMQDLGMNFMLGGSYVSRYERPDTILTVSDGHLYRYNLPQWVGAGDVRTEWQWKGWDVLVEYAYKANNPATENDFSYRHGDALLASLSYSRRGLSLLAQMKRSDNMSFRSQSEFYGVAGRLNLLPAFDKQHTYHLPALNGYATRYADGEWAFQTELRYTWPRKSRFGGKYGTTLAFAASHIRGLASPGSWAMDTSRDGEYYTDINIELNKRLSKRWWLNAMLMYQTINLTVVQGHGGLVRSGIAVLDARFQVNSNVSMRGELQYLYTPHFNGQWLFALYELTLYRCLTLSADWLYNIGHAPEATNEHFYSVSATYTNGAHRLSLGYTKTREGFHCAGGVCRFIPRQQGLTLSYNFSW